MLETWFIIAVVVIVYAIYREINIRDQVKYFEDRGIVALRQESFLTRLKIFLSLNITDIIDRLYKTYKDQRVIGSYEANIPVYVIRDPILARDIMIKGFDHFTDHLPFLDPEIDPLFGQSLIALRGNRWRAMRNALSPTFTGSKMRLMFELVQQCSEQMSSYFLEQCNKFGPQIYDMKDICSKLTNDVIATCAFGVKCDSLREPENEFFRIGQKIVNFQSPLNLLKFMVYNMFRFPIVGKLLNLKVIDGLGQRVFTDIIRETIKVREENGIVRPDMVNILMELKKGQLSVTDEKEINKSIIIGADHVPQSSNSKQTWTDDQLIPQCFIFFVAGFDTTSTLMSFIAYELATNPGIQHTLLEEVDRINSELAGIPLDYDRLQSMRYMDMVVAETLRKWPPLPFVDRFCNEDYTYHEESGFSLTIRKGSALFFPSYSIQHDEKYFPNPDIFDPGRFSSDKKGSNDMNAYAPFGIGPRNCIGSRFALMETKSVMYHLLVNFKFEVCEKTDIPVKLKKTMLGLIPKRVQLKLKPRLKC